MLSNKPTKPKVFVGLSGGVDSSVSAALLQKQGFDVTGVFIKVWHPDFLPCDWKEERRDAMRVCAKLAIPFVTLDLEKEYKKEVVDYMISEYEVGRTPNPDVMCNKHIKFGSFLSQALSMGADYVATGHYAQVKEAEKNGVKTFELWESKDKAKDQSYFLWTLTQKELSHTLMPVGGLTKPEVRRLASKHGLHTSTKKDSQGLCFMGKIDMKQFLAHFIHAEKGKVLDEAGTVIGEHDGALFYTIGERRGFTITQKTPHDEPWFVSEKDTKENTITVSHKKNQGPLQLTKELVLKQVSWTVEAPKVGMKLLGRIRYHQKPQSLTLTKLNETEAEIVFDEPQDAAAGQSLVLYNGEKCIGGGIME